MPRSADGRATPATAQALAELPPDAFVLVDFRTRAVQGGYLEEDGEIWSEDGVLLAQARQVGVVL